MKPWKPLLIAVPFVLTVSVIALAIYGNSVPQITALPEPPIPNPNAFDEFALAYSKFHDLDIPFRNSSSRSLAYAGACRSSMWRAAER